ncbi:MAG TPA: phosphotransferase [Gaiellaceae bacterium]|nr:phosphotransferase [Gaiellaceae bacterium]
MPEWDAEVAIDAPLVRSLLSEQFPDLDAGSARLVGEGWDNSVWVVEEAWAFRFPRRAIAIPGVEREIAVLPLLAPLLPAPIPEPHFVGVPSERFAWPFFGAPLLSGREPAEAELGDETRIELGAQLGRFLRALHDVELDVSLPDDPIRRADMPFRVARTREKLAVLESWRPPRELDDVLVAAEQLPPSTNSAVTHGDLHLRHLLVDDGALTGVIDWGDMCRSDPAIDLMVVWSLLPPAGRERFLVEYGSVGEDARLRARVLAVFLGITLALYARAVGHESLERECLAGLDRTLADWD